MNSAQRNLGKVANEATVFDYVDCSQSTRIRQNASSGPHVSFLKCVHPNSNSLAMMNSARLLIAAFGAASLVVLGIFCFRHRGAPAGPPHQSVRLLQEQAAHIPARPEAIPTRTVDAKVQESGQSVEESALPPPISEFRQWAESSVAAGFTQADETNGLKLAKARAAAMKALIQKDPASALRQALPGDLRASLPKQIAAAIEQPVQTIGMCSIRMMCNHSPDAPHGNCEATPVLLEEVTFWNAYYGSRQWRRYVGQEVGFDGIAVEEELAVRSITPISNNEKD